MLKVLGVVLELAGLALLAGAAWLVSPVAGLAAAGAACIVVGLAAGGER